MTAPTIPEQVAAKLLGFTFFVVDDYATMRRLIHKDRRVVTSIPAHDLNGSDVRFGHYSPGIWLPD